MKANVPKRKVFQDAVDLLGMPEEVNVPVSNGQTMIPTEKIIPFHNHPFRLYEGERLADMVESIKEHGVLNPVIVQKVADKYEMLAGHNRWNAAKIAGVREIPAIVKEGLSEEEAYVYVIETNLMQRSFTDLLPSEKAAVLAERYEKVMCQGKRNAILEEIARLNGVDASDTCGHDVHKSKNRDSIGEDYGMTRRNIARYMRLNQTMLWSSFFVTLLAYKIRFFFLLVSMVFSLFWFAFFVFLFGLNFYEIDSLFRASNGVW